MGLFGLFGFLGFLGFWTYAAQRVIFPFFFFIFFGFFGFYYEGKLSDTLADEMFEEHRLKAQLKAYKIGMSLIFPDAVAGRLWFIQSTAGLCRDLSDHRNFPGLCRYGVHERISVISL